MFVPRTLIALIAAAPLALAGAQPGMAQSGVKVGILRCFTGSATGFVVGSSRHVNCTYSAFAGGPREHYRGRIDRWGVDLGYLRGGTLVWAVFAPVSGALRGALAGDYGGLGADVAAGAGVGANALIGGFRRSIALQPVDVEGLTGLHLAAGVTALSLRPSHPASAKLGGLPPDAYPQ
jgi:hypothetical protein